MNPEKQKNILPMKLPTVTLLGIDCVDIARLERAAEISMRGIEFGAVKLLTHQHSNNPHIVPIVRLENVKEYNDFVIRNLYKYVDTKHVLIIQYDGFVLNPKAWRSEFLQYDYIGAPWWYTDGMNVGNGGFSLRSKKLLELTPRIIKNTFPEDEKICRTHRKELEALGICFAPENVAIDFSIENGKYTNEFGFHNLKKTDITSFLREHPDISIPSVPSQFYWRLKNSWINKIRRSFI